MSKSNGIILFQSSICFEFFLGHYRRRGSGFGALGSCIGRIALLLERKFIVPAAKHVEKEHLLQSVPELIDDVSKKITKVSSEKHDINYSQKANRWLTDTANETKTNES